ncbi:septum site-determining protein MinC [Alkalibacillus haloalkaliphilus]|uniref:septum site-determining protein MinC n=1 Tax=Alkalibacillus haloalkaliphilus TaxID=94136 RepID=UPI002935B7F1|nr:septum site-determining protein MinC [Alkalibacillus haloalkaliphilus]MDV2581121.1 septum site-determining protein MinC [Alkalibacillus haloalkaliphilus]
MTETNLYLTMKGTNEGIIVYLDDQCSFTNLLNELGNQVKSDTIENTTEVIINCQNRYLQDWQREEIRQVVEEQSSLKVKSIESNVMSHEEALTWFDRSTIKPFVKTVRSGQVLHVEGDALIIGDINPGATVNATGNIFVMGQLKGIAHAGYAEGTDHVVVASYMNPNQIRIANKISRAPDYEMQGSSREFAYINQETGQIELEQIHNLQKIRPNLTDIVERGL